MPSSVVNGRGQVTLPVEVRRRLGLREGDRVEFVFEEERTFLRPSQPAQNPFEAYLGALPAFSSRDDVNAWVRILRDDEVCNGSCG
jgi:AbrB family looped-hinge helix DNA binding protein